MDLGTGVSIVADAANNSLLIKAPPREYKKILDALKQLDIVPLQVLVEATIVEVTLSGSLRYGVQWQFFGGKADARSDYSLVNPYHPRAHRARPSRASTGPSSTTSGPSRPP